MPRIDEEIKQDVVDQLVWDERVNAAQVIEWSGIAPSDTNLRANVELALQWHPNLDASHMSIDVSDGVVTLSGSVPNGAALRAARHAAYYTEGVMDVQDNLVVLS